MKAFVVPADIDAVRLRVTGGKSNSCRVTKCLAGFEIIEARRRAGIGLRGDFKGRVGLVAFPQRDGEDAQIARDLPRQLPFQLQNMPIAETPGIEADGVAKY